jgi:hypothetical protein
MPPFQDSKKLAIEKNNEILYLDYKSKFNWHSGAHGKQIRICSFLHIKKYGTVQLIHALQRM